MGRELTMLMQQFDSEYKDESFMILLNICLYGSLSDTRMNLSLFSLISSSSLISNKLTSSSLESAAFSSAPGFPWGFLVQSYLLDLVVVPIIWLLVLFLLAIQFYHYSVPKDNYKESLRLVKKHQTRADDKKDTYQSTSAVFMHFTNT